MKFKQFLKKRWELYLIIGVFCFFLYLLIADNTVLGIIIGLVVSEITNYFDFAERLQADEEAAKAAADKQKAEPLMYSKEEVDEKLKLERVRIVRKKQLFWKRLGLYALVLFFLWALANLYLYITND
jgi:hypothetical protein